MSYQTPFCAGLLRAVRGERAAALEYGRLAGMGPTPAARRILAIRADELRHRPQFAAMLRTYCR